MCTGKRPVSVEETPSINQISPGEWLKDFSESVSSWLRLTKKDWLFLCDLCVLARNHFSVVYWQRLSFRGNQVSFCSVATITPNSLAKVTTWIREFKVKPQLITGYFKRLPEFNKSAHPVRHTQQLWTESRLLSSFFWLVFGRVRRAHPTKNLIIPWPTFLYSE